MNALCCVGDTSKMKTSFSAQFTLNSISVSFAMSEYLACSTTTWMFEDQRRKKNRLNKRRSRDARRRVATLYEVHTNGGQCVDMSGPISHEDPGDLIPSLTRFSPGFGNGSSALHTNTSMHTPPGSVEQIRDRIPTTTIAPETFSDATTSGHRSVQSLILASDYESRRATENLNFEPFQEPCPQQGRTTTAGCLNDDYYAFEYMESLGEIPYGESGLVGGVTPQNDTQLLQEDTNTQSSAHLAIPTGQNDCALNLTDVSSVLATATVSHSPQIESSKNNDLNKPFIVACTRGHVNVSKVLLEAGADVNCADSSGLTALHFAARHGYDSLVQILIRFGADISVEDGEGNTPLYYAAEQGHEMIVKRLARSTISYPLTD